MTRGSRLVIDGISTKAVQSSGVMSRVTIMSLSHDELIGAGQNLDVFVLAWDK